MFIKKKYPILLFIVLFTSLLIPLHIAGDYQYRADYLTGDGPHAIGTADLDADGDIDIVTADYNSDNVSILLNDGKGVFAKAGQFPTGDGPRSLAAGDIDSDNDIDIVTANWHDDTISVLKNNGDGTFASRTEFDVDTGPYSVFLADIGEDGSSDLDVIVAADQADRISVLENDGSGGFGNMKSLKVGARPKGVFAMDMDLDGAVDIACVNWADNTVSVLQNKGDGTFFNHIEYDTGSTPRSIYMATLNNDIAPDIVCANQGDGNVSVIMNDGDGTFGTKTDYAVGDNPLSATCGDVDSDGDFDILTTNSNNNSVTLLYNDGFGNFFERTDFESGWGPTQVLLSEVNKDGKLDIITANNFGDSISVRYSNFPPLITIFEPDGSDDTTNATYTITWGDFDPDEDAEITLFWDDDDSGRDGTVIAQGISEDNDGSGGTFLWDTTDLTEGDYWVYAKIEDSVFEPVYDYSSGPLTIDRSYEANTPPTFHFTEPDGQNDFADGQFTITWTDSDPDDDASISLYYDREGDVAGEILIMDGLSEDMDGNFGFYTWDTALLPDGQYFVTAISDDGQNDPVTATSSDPVLVNHNTTTQDVAPLIHILEPDGIDDYAHTEYMITWFDSDDDSDALISLYYDSDSSGYDGVLIAEGIQENDYGTSGAYIWDTSTLAQGTYHIYGLITDSENEARDYGSGPVVVSHNGTFNTAPSILEISPLEGEDMADENYTIHWIDLDPDDDAAISLYYDSDQMGFDGVLIVSGISENDETDSYVWNTRDVPQGRYFIYGTIEDGTNRPAHDYSHGTLEISHGTGNGDEKREELIGYSYGQFGLCFSLSLVLILVLALFLFMRTKKEKAQMDLLLYEKIRKEKGQGEHEDFTKGDQTEPEKSKDKTLSEDDEDVDEDLLPPPEDEMPPPSHK